MNAKQTAPLLVMLATAAPPLLVGGAIGYGIWLLVKCLSEDSKEDKAETMPATPEAEISRKSAESDEFRPIPPEIPAKSAAAAPALSIPRPANQQAAVQPLTVRSTFVQPVPAIAKADLPAKQQPTSKRFITRADMQTIFDSGGRPLTRTAAVVALKQLGFGKTAAYAALSPDGRFKAWLVCAPDGVIAWKQ